MLNMEALARDALMRNPASFPELSPRGSSSRLRLFRACICVKYWAYFSLYKGSVYRNQVLSSRSGIAHQQRHEFPISSHTADHSHVNCNVGLRLFSHRCIQTPFERNLDSKAAVSGETNETRKVCHFRKLIENHIKQPRYGTSIVIRNLCRELLRQNCSQLICTP